MELRHLRYFIAVAEELSFSRAAQRLHVSQPPLSRQVRDLESELKLRLFERDRQGVELTAAGRGLLARARRLVRGADTLRLEAQLLDQRRQDDLHVGYRPSPTATIIAGVLGRYHELAPGTRVTLHEMPHREMVAQVRSRRLDAALTIRPSAGELRGLRFEPIRRHGAGIICAHAHPLAGRVSVTPSAIRGLPLVSYRQRDFAEYRTWAARVLKAKPDRLRIEQECDGVLGVIATVESGRGVAVVGDFVTATAGGRVSYVPFSRTTHTLEVGLVHRPSAAINSLARFIEACRACREDGAG